LEFGIFLLDFGIFCPTVLSVLCRFCYELMFEFKQNPNRVVGAQLCGISVFEQQSFSMDRRIGLKIMTLLHPVRLD